MTPVATRPLFFRHIHKTAGSSMVTFLDRHFSREGICPCRFEHELVRLPPEEIRRCRLFRGHLNPETVARHAGPVDEITFLRDPGPRILSCYYFWREEDLRQPDPARIPLVQRKMLGLSLEDLVTTRDPDLRRALDNVQARLLAGGRFGDTLMTRNQVFGPDLPAAEILAAAKAAIDRFAFVGVTEDFAFSVRRLAGIFGWPVPAEMPRDNVTVVTRPDQPMTPGIAAAIDALTSLDLAVYAYARARLGLP